MVRALCKAVAAPGNNNLGSIINYLSVTTEKSFPYHQRFSSDFELFCLNRVYSSSEVSGNIGYVPAVENISGYFQTSDDFIPVAKNVRCGLCTWGLVIWRSVK